MKRPLIIAALIIVCLSIITATFSFERQTAQSCMGDPGERREQRIMWLWEWLPYADNDSGAFIACVGTSTYVVYRPLDVAALGVVVTITLLSIDVVKRKK